MGTEDILIKNIKNGIRSIKLGNKSPQEANIGTFLNRLKDINEGMHLDLMNDYKATVKAYNDKHPKKDQ